ncbi:MAG: lamin tail domain-containing protein [Kiritimatiellia bacterium]
MINEISANGFVELFNRGRDPLALDGCGLADASVTNRWVFAPGVTIAPGGFLVVPAASLPFALPVTGGRVLLTNAAATRVLDARVFDPTLGGTSHGLTTAGEWSVLASATPGSANAARERPVVISEINYHPLSDDPGEEWIELHNPGAAPVDISGWRLDGGVRFTFAAGVVLAPGERLVVAAGRAALLARYPPVDPARVHGDWTGSLANSGDRVQLERPFDPVVPGTPFLRVDGVAYRDGGAWGEWADAGGGTLERRDDRAESDAGANWAASNETLSAPWACFLHHQRPRTGHGRL